MNLIDRVRVALAGPTVIDPAVFEECATALLSDVFKGLAPVRGGSDWGSDADIVNADRDRIWVAITSSRGYPEARKNLARSMRSIRDHGLNGDRIIAVSLASVDRRKRDSLSKMAIAAGFELMQVFDRHYFEDQLLRWGDWRERLLGIRGGPYTLSARSPRGVGIVLDEIVGRDEALQRLTQTSRDVIVVGPPGIGKTATVEAVPEIRFVADDQATSADLLRDILDDQPIVIAVDDAARTTGLLESLRTLRAQERRPFRIVAICWPQQLRTLQIHLQDAVVVELEPLPRPEIGKICARHGIRRHDLVGQVIAQAHGRPGWAVRLIALLLADGGRDSFFSGAALGEWVSQYMLRSGLPAESLGLLGTVSLLGSLDSDECDGLALLFGLPGARLRGMINDLAAGGLLDVDNGRDGGLRYSVAPPQVQPNLIFRVFLQSQLPPVPAHEIYKSFPTHRVTIATNLVRAARAGDIREHAIATSLALEALGEAHLPGDSGRLIQESVLLNRRTAEAALDLVEAVLVPLRSGLGATHYALAALGGCEREATARFLETLVKAVPETRHLSTAIGEFVTTIRQFGPYPIAQVDALVQAGQEAQRWYRAHRSSDAARVHAYLVAAMMAPVYDSHYTTPDDRMSVTLIAGALDVAQMNRVMTDIWAPFSRAHTEPLPAQMTTPLIALAESWARTGRGIGMLYNGTVSNAQQSRARALGRMMARWIRDHLPDNPLIRQRFRIAVETLGVRIAEPPSLAQILLQRTPLRGDWAMARQAQADRLKTEVAAMTPHHLAAEVQQLRGYEHEIEDRMPTFNLWGLWRAVDELHDDLRPWIGALEEIDLLDYAAPLVAAAARRGQLNTTDVGPMLERPTLRQALISVVLELDINVSDRVLDDVTASELLPLEYQADQIPEAALTALLTHQSDEVAGMTALLLVNPEHPATISDDIQPMWNDAISRLPLPLPAQTTNDPSHLLGLADAAPQQLAELLTRADPTDHAAGYSLPWNDLRLAGPRLPDELRTKIMSHWRDSVVAHQVLRAMTGDDIAWLAANVQTGLISPELALSAHSGDGPQPSIDEMAGLLVPLGVSPLAIGTAIEFATGWGEDHELITDYLRYFETLEDHPDASVRAVAAAATTHYRRELQSASKEAKRRAI